MDTQNEPGPEVVAVPPELVAAATAGVTGAQPDVGPPHPDTAPPDEAGPADRADGRPRPVAAELRDWSAAVLEPRLEGLARGLQHLADRQDELQRLFEARIASDEVQAKALEKLHDQVRDYRVNFVREEMKPLLRDLTFCYDYAAAEVEGARAATAGDGPPPSAQDAARAFEHLLQMIADVLSKYDLEAFRTEGGTFDQKTQQCVRTVPTGVEADHKKIAAVGAIGFRSADLILRKEQVTVYKYTAGAASGSPETS